MHRAPGRTELAGQSLQDRACRTELARQRAACRTGVFAEAVGHKYGCRTESSYKTCIHQPAGQRAVYRMENSYKSACRTESAKLKIGLQDTECAREKQDKSIPETIDN